MSNATTTPTTYYLAHSEASLQNASFYRVKTGRKVTTVTRYVNGDYMGETSVVPSGLNTFTVSVAKQFLPKGYR